MTQYVSTPILRRIYTALTTTSMIATVGIMGLSLSASPVDADSFRKLNGRWSGGGSASFVNGQRERLRCNATYTNGGRRLGIRLRCASPSAQINLSGSLDRAGRRVSGGWRENGFGYSGSAFGSSNANGIRLRIRGDLNGYLRLNVSGRNHSLALSSQGTTLKGVNVRMRRR